MYWNHCVCIRNGLIELNMPVRVFVTFVRFSVSVMWVWAENEWSVTVFDTFSETLAVNSSLENDFPKFAGYVQTKLDELILKHSFIPETSTAFPSARWQSHSPTSLQMAGLLMKREFMSWSSSLHTASRKYLVVRTFALLYFTYSRRCNTILHLTCLTVIVKRRNYKLGDIIYWDVSCMTANICYLLRKSDRHQSPCFEPYCKDFRGLSNILSNCYFSWPQRQFSICLCYLILIRFQIVVV